MKRVKVGLFGYYSHGNFGDNLMAMLFEERLSQIGVEVIVMTSCGMLAQQLRSKVVTDIASLVGESDVIFIGGGGLLVPNPKGGSEFNRQIGELVRRCKIANKEIYGFSLGGEGLPYREIVPQPRRDLVAACRFITLRNEEDLHLLNEAGIKGTYFPDVVWTSCQFFSKSSVVKDRVVRIGVCLRISRGKRRSLVEILIRLAARVRPGIRVDFLAVNGRDVVDGSAVQLKNAGNQSSIIVLEDVEQCCIVLSELDILVTNKLHVGVVAMSYGVPVLSFGGEPKTRLLYRRLGLEAYCVGPNNIFSLLAIFSRKFISKAASRFSDKVDKTLLNGAFQHFRTMEDIIENISQR